MRVDDVFSAIGSPFFSASLARFGDYPRLVGSARREASLLELKRKIKTHRHLAQELREAPFALDGRPRAQELRRVVITLALAATARGLHCNGREVKGVERKLERVPRGSQIFSKERGSGVTARRERARMEMTTKGKSFPNNSEFSFFVYFSFSLSSSINSDKTNWRLSSPSAALVLFRALQQRWRRRPAAAARRPAQPRPSTFSRC